MPPLQPSCRRDAGATSHAGGTPALRLMPAGRRRQVSCRRDAGATSDRLTLVEPARHFHLTQLLAAHPQLDDLEVAPVLLDVTQPVAAGGPQEVHGVLEVLDRAVARDIIVGDAVGDDLVS